MTMSGALPRTPELWVRLGPGWGVRLKASDLDGSTCVLITGGQGRLCLCFLVLASKALRTAVRLLYISGY